jgi:hypothetical protein
MLQTNQARIAATQIGGGEAHSIRRAGRQVTGAKTSARRGGDRARSGVVSLEIEL